MKNPAFVVPNALSALYALGGAVRKAGVPPVVLYLSSLRAAQINGCAFCVDMHARELVAAGESQERVFGVAAWRDSPFYSAAERAALALTEAATRLADRSDGVPDDVWAEAARHFEETALAALVLNIASINFWTRVNVTTRQVARSVVVPETEVA